MYSQESIENIPEENDMLVLKDFSKKKTVMKSIDTSKKTKTSLTEVKILIPEKSTEIKLVLPQASAARTTIDFF